MKYDGTVYRMIEEFQKQISPIEQYERLYSAASRDALQLLEEKEKLLQNLVPEMEQRYLRIAEFARSELEGYKTSTLTATHMAEIGNASSIVLDFVKNQETLNCMTQEAINASKYWQAELDVYKSFSSEAEARRLALMGHYSDVAELSFIAQERVQQLDWSTIRRATDSHQMISRTAASSFSNLLENYDHLFRSFKEAEYKMASFPPFVSALPPVEIITGSDFLVTISRRGQAPSPQHVENSQIQIAKDIEISLEDLLDKLNPTLIPLWQGAKTALKAHNPDRPRHIVVSLRELLTHVLQQTAPDDLIRSWTTDPSYFDKGRPTRKARLHYLCRDLNHKPFEQFVTSDVSAHLELIQVLQRGTHDLSVSLTDEQLGTLVLKTESLVRFILVIWSSKND